MNRLISIRNAFCLILAVSTLAMRNGTALAAIIFSETFNGITIASDPPGEPVTTLNSAFTTTAAPGANNSTNARIDGGSLFGLGDTNQYLEVIKNASGTGSLNVVLRGPAAISNAGFQSTFDFYEPDADNNSGVRMQLGNSTSATTSRSLDLSVGQGELKQADSGGVLQSISNYSLSAKHSVIIVGNLTNATINYGLGNSQSVAPKTFDLWLDTALVGNDRAFRNAAVTSATHFLVGSNDLALTISTGVYFDNFEIQDSITTLVPEPAGAILAALAGSIAFSVRGFRMRLGRKKT